MTLQLYYVSKLGESGFNLLHGTTVEMRAKIPPPPFYNLIGLRAVAFQLNVKYLHVKITNLLWVV